MSSENKRVQTLAKLISRVLVLSKKWKILETPCILACFDRQKRINIESNQQHANYTKSDERLVSK